MPCCCFLFLSFFLSPVWKQGKNNQIICMTCMCLVKVQLESRGVSGAAAAAWSVFRAATMLRLLAQRAAPATASKAAPKGSPPSHTPTQATFLFLMQLLASALRCLWRCCGAWEAQLQPAVLWLWLWPLGSGSSEVPCEVGSTELRGSEVVTEESKVELFLWNLPLYIKNGSMEGWEERSPISDCVSSLQLFVSVAFALVCSDMNQSSLSFAV